MDIQLSMAIDVIIEWKTEVIFTFAINNNDK